jgi:hypothetical protein
VPEHVRMGFIADTGLNACQDQAVSASRDAL